MKGLVAGQCVDQFRIVRKLGQGGMSEVYLARDLKLGRKVALKIIRTELANSPRRLELFLNEARLTAKFSHPHIIAIHSVGEFDGHPYLALEYLEGQTLRQRMNKGAMSVHETMRIGLAIAQALEEAHSHGVLHRDLKPANIIIPQNGRLRVLDFGISKIAENSLHSLGTPNDVVADLKPEETAFGVVRGTPTYMAPERWLGDHATGAADVWALGVLLYKMLTQVHPFHSDDRAIDAIARRIVSAHEPPPFPAEVELPPELAQLIRAMLDADASRRPTGKQIVEVLQQLLHHRRDKVLEKGSPFRGLLPFSERHADFFFGRSAEIEMALERLRHEPILPVVGPSGAGKSSFVAAGIVPRLRECDQWLVLTVRPGTDPFATLGSIIEAGWKGDPANRTSPSSTDAPKFFMAGVDSPAKVKTAAAAFLQLGKNVLQEADLELSETVPDTKLLSKNDATKKASSQELLDDSGEVSIKLAQKFLENPATLLLELQTLADETQAKVLLFVDQLEELYTLEHTPAHRRAYMEAISQAADDPEGPIRVIFTLRDDFLGRVVESPSARETLTHILVLGAPEKAALQEVVTRPVELAGYTYEDEDLPEEMIDAVRDTPASLPILQFACSQLWNRRNATQRLLTRAAYEAMGGVEGALASKADELLAGLTEAQRKVVRQLMLRLVTPEGTRRVIAPKELLDGLDSNAALALDRLTAARMVVARRAVHKDRTESELELVHDSLIHSWKPLVRWLEQSREEVIFLDEVSRAAELWDSRGRPDAEAWSGGALEEALTKVERCDAVPQRVTEFLEAGVISRHARAGKRRRIIFAIIGTLLAVIAVLAMVIREVDIQRGIAVTQRDRERQARASALREGARAAYTKGEFLEARSKLRSSLEVRDSTQARALWWLLENEPLIWSKSLDSFGNSVSVSPDGRLVAVSSKYINIFDTKTLERRVLSGHRKEVQCLDFSPNGRRLSSGSDDQDIRLWNLRDGTATVLKGHTGVVEATVFLPDGKNLISTSRDNTIKVWNLESGTPTHTFKFEYRIWGITVSADGRFIISVSSDEKVRFWNTESYELEQVIEEPDMHIVDTVTSADGKLLAYGSWEGVVIVRNLKTRQELARISGRSGYIRSLNFSSNGDFLAASTGNGTVLVWNTNTWALHRQFHHAKIPVNSVAFLPEGEQLVSASDDETLKLWKMNVLSLPEHNAGHSSPVYALAFAPDGKTITTGSSVNGEIRLWDTASSQLIRRIEGHDTDISDIAFDHTGKLLAAGDINGSIRLYRVPEGKLLKTLLGHESAVTRVIFSRNGTQLISSSHDETIAFWNLEKLTLEKSLATGNIVCSIDIDPEGHLIASASRDSVEVRNIETGQVLRNFAGHTDRLFSVAFSPDGKSLYSSSWDYTVRRYQIGNTSGNGEVVARHHGNIYFIDVTHFTADILGTPSADETAKLWDIKSHEFITLKGHRDEVNALQFSPDGTKAATVSDDSTLRLWDTKTGKPLWRAPLMLEEPPLIFTQQGWTSFESDEEPSPSMRQWEKAVDTRGKLASATVDGQTLCVVTFDDELEIWDIPNDECIFKTRQPGIQQILAIRQACFMRFDENLTLMKATGDSVNFGKHVDALSRFRDSVFTLQSGKVRILDLDGNQQDEFTATAGASALTVVGDTIALGFPDRRFEIWKREKSKAERLLACREIESSAVTRIIPGPPGTIIAGFANGTVGIWSLKTGERLYTQRLHGPIVHLLHRDQSLVAATELGSKIQLDLSMFYMDYCELMERVWSSVPWIWEEGRPRYHERPTDHICTRRGLNSE